MDELETFKQTFFAECGELLADMEDRLSRLSPETTDKQEMNAIFRAAHSIKGGAGAFGFTQMMGFTHALEAMLDGLREDRLVLTRAGIDALLRASDILSRMLEGAKAGTTLAEADFRDVLQLLEQLAGGSGNNPGTDTPLVVDAGAGANDQPAGAGAGNETAIWQIRFKPHGDFFNNGSEPILALRQFPRFGATQIAIDTADLPTLDKLHPETCYLGWSVILESGAGEAAIRDPFEFIEDLAEITLVRQAAAEAITEPVTEPSSNTASVNEAPVTAVAVTVPGGSTAGAATPPAATATASIRVDLDRIDRLVNTVGELVITEAMLRAKLRAQLDLMTEDQTGSLAAGLAEGLSNGLDQLSQHTRELQDSVMSIRMQPVKSVFSRMPRLVRDTAVQLNKELKLVMSGETTEVDKTVIEQLNDPLTHMIRNSADHGIEAPDRRVEKGKPREGTITLSAYQRSGKILIEIADDGNGIDRARVLGKAKEKGLLAPGAQLSDEEIDHLIFLPGFSTAEQVTSVSGRGVGMDVVRRNIETLGGTVRITNNPGIGSTFTISLPLTLAILDGMVVRVGDEDYIIPISSIIETLRASSGAIHSIQGHGDMMDVRGDLVPLIYLHRIFGVTNAQQDIGNSLIVLVESGTQKMGIVVDELAGQQQVVIKSLEPNSNPVPGISSATILGDGKVALIIEINDLKRLNNQYAQQEQVEAA